jgi:hypothetical protein
MPNHYLTIGLCSIDSNTDEFEPEAIEELNGKNLCALINPMPEIDDPNAWYDWCVENWGTKWGTYETQARVLNGDGSPILISFVSAWNPPNAATMKKIEEFLKTQYHIKSILWAGHEPYDNSVQLLTFTQGTVPGRLFHES